MLRTNFVVAVRNIAKFKGNSSINIIGLALALSSMLLIYLWIHDEVTFDHHHEKVDRIFKVNSRVYTADNQWHIGVTPTAWGPALATDFSEIESAARISNRRDITFGYDADYVIESDFVWADSTVFDIFSIPFLIGDPETALNRSFSVVLSREVAETRFGSIEAALGKVITVNGHDVPYEITGVIDNQPHNSLLSVRGLLSMVTRYTDRHPRPRPYSFRAHYDHTFLLATPGTGAKQIESLFPRMFERHLPDSIQTRYKPEVINLGDVHLRSTVEELTPVGSITQVRLFAFIGLIILAVAVANFVNLTMAHLARRVASLSVRKILGASRRHIIYEVSIQAALIGLCAIALAVVIAESAVGYLNSLTGKHLSLLVGDYFGLALFTMALMLIIGIASLLPIGMMAWQRPIKYLSGRQLTSGKSSVFRSTLMAFQFGVSIALLLATITILRQTEYLERADVGFEPEQLVTIETTDNIRQSLPALRQSLTQHPGIKSVSACYVLPSVTTVARSYSVADAPDERMLTTTYFVDEQFIPVLGLDLLEGRNFSPERPTDSIAAFVVNAAFVRSMGWESGLGKRLTYHRGDMDESGHIIGVVRDFAQSTLHNEIEPCVMQIESEARSYNIVARISNYDRSEVLAYIGNVWQDFEPQRPFQYRFYDDILVNQYQSEDRLGSIVFAFAFLSVVIAALGMFGLVSYKTEQLQKEIGLRKVLGATTINIASLISRDFVKILSIATVIALPATHFAITRWLQNFAHRVDITIWTYLAACAIVATVVMITVNVKAFKAAKKNPVDALRYE